MVALDGSDADGRAVATASAVAAIADSDLHFVRAIEEDAPAAARDDAEASLARVVASLPPRTGGVSTSVLNAANVAESLIEHAIAGDALVIVMATQPERAGSHAIAGSVADHVMRESRQPVMLIPPGAGFPSGTPPTIHRVLVPLDDSSLSFRSIEFIIDLPRAMDLEFVLLEVVPDDDVRETAERRLGQTALWLRSRGPKAVATHVLTSIEVATAILGLAREASVDAIVMSTHGAGGLRRVLLGSVAEHVVRRSEVPVMLLTPLMLAQLHALHG
jgi:nucleotide-binding universal stress UspA family protein